MTHTPWWRCRARIDGRIVDLSTGGADGLTRLVAYVRERGGEVIGLANAGTWDPWRGLRHEAGIPG